MSARLGQMLAEGSKSARNTGRPFSLLDLAFDRYAVIGLPHWLHILQSELMTILVKAVTASRCGHDKAGSIAV